MTAIALLATALLFGGMVLYAFGFAAFVFSALPAETAGPLIRKAFPWFYLFVLASSALAAVAAAFGDTIAALILAGVAVTTLYARQVLMPAINRATDSGNRRRFAWLHGFSVAITLGHIGAAAVVLLRLADS